MKRMKQIGVSLLFLLFLLMPTTAFAADIGVQLNGEDVSFTDAAPVNENGRVYVPFRAVFEALDATVDYRAEEGLITAEKNGLTVSFQVGQNTVTVDNGVMTDITIDAVPFIRNGRTYVPVRFAAQTLGLEVGWDSDAKTVVMLDKATLKDQTSGQYTLMDQYMTYAASQNLLGPVNVSGDLNMEMLWMSGSGDDKAMIPLAGTAKISGISATEAANMNVAVALNVDDLRAVMEMNAALNTLTAEDQALLNALEQLNMQLIVNNQDGKTYMQSGIFAMSDLDGNAWQMMNLNKQAFSSGFNLQSLLEIEAVTGGSFEESAVQMIDHLLPENAAQCKLLLKMLEMYRDDSFQYINGGYMSSMKNTVDNSAAGNSDISMSITLKTNGSAVTGYQQATVTYVNNVPVMTMKIDQSGNRSAVDLTIHVQDQLTLTLNGPLQYTATQERPQMAPPAGAVIQDLK